jgi:HEAT repeat protein
VRVLTSGIILKEFEVTNWIKFICFVFLLPPALYADSLAHSAFQRGQILFLVQKGDHEKGLNQYQTLSNNAHEHDFELLHEIALRILDEGFRHKDPECQLLALFGASVSAHEDVYYILEESLKSKFPEIQLVAVDALARFQNDRADLAMIRALGASTLRVRLEAAHQLCKKKHPQAVNQTESLLYKSPTEIWVLYPPLFAMVGDSHSTRVLRKLLVHPSESVRLSVILSLSKYRREDLLPQIKQQAGHLQYSLQEACADACGKMKDESAVDILEKLATSQYPSVALAAHTALFQLGREESLAALQQTAMNEDIFAIASLGSLGVCTDTLEKLCQSHNLQTRINAIIALLEQNHPQGVEFIDEILIRDKRDLAFTTTLSPGKTLKAWKATPSASQLLKDDIGAYHEHLRLKESLLNKLRLLSPEHFVKTAHLIFNRQQNDLIATVVQLLEELNTPGSIACLKEHQQQLGAPLIRQYCNLALFRLAEPGPYGDLLCEWVKGQNLTEFIRMKPFIPWESGEDTYTLKPEETSKLLIESFEALAAHQDARGLDTLIEAIASGHAKNKYALAGLLLRATQ